MDEVDASGGSTAEPCGLLNLHKPAGVTSRRVVDWIARLAPGVKVGHTGTLDPMASGVLVVCVGGATRLVDYVQRMPKTYRASFLLGRQSPTEDTEGEVTELPDPPVPSLDEVRRKAAALTGRIQQRPPAFSALKVRGRRAYAAARKGKLPELKPRPVVVHRLEVLAYDYPRLELGIECGSGTYVRSLGRDLAASLGTAAVMCGLVRTAIGQFTLTEALDPKALTKENFRDHLLPPIRAAGSLVQIKLTGPELAAVRQGRTIRRPTATGGQRELAAVDASGRLVAILSRRGPGLLGPKRNLLTGPCAPRG